jgi:hypothetical protein
VRSESGQDDLADCRPGFDLGVGTAQVRGVDRASFLGQGAAQQAGADEPGDLFADPGDRADRRRAARACSPSSASSAVNARSAAPRSEASAPREAGSRNDEPPPVRDDFDLQAAGWF